MEIMAIQAIYPNLLKLDSQHKIFPYLFGDKKLKS